MSIKNIRAEVYCTLQMEGTHSWPGCPIEEVSYLRLNHRHVFHIKAWKAVFHDDRDVEFIYLKHRIEDYLREKYYTNDGHVHVLGATSCEMLARELIDEFELTRCEVNEDNENGAYLEVL